LSTEKSDLSSNPSLKEFVRVKMNACAGGKSDPLQHSETGRLKRFSRVAILVPPTD
jgi:hypothetical protein